MPVTETTTAEATEAQPIYPLALNMERGDIQCTSIEAARELFLTPGALRPFVEMIEADARGLVADVNTRDGRKQIVDNCKWLKKVTNRFDDFRKNIVAELKEMPKKVDENGRIARVYLENVHADLIRPILEIEGREEKLRILADRPNILTAADAATLARELAEAQAMDDSAEEWKESTATAKAVKIGLVEALEAMLDKRKAHEAELAEFEAHKKAKAEKELRERIERETREKIEREQAEKEAAAKRAEAARIEGERKARERMDAEKKFNADVASVATQPEPAQDADAEAYADLQKTFRVASYRDPIRFVLDEIKRGNIRHITANI